MRLREINRLSEQYVLDESISDLYHSMVNKAQYLMGRMENGRPKLVVEKEINEFYDRFKDILPTIRTILAFDSHAKKSDPDRPSLSGIARLLNSPEKETIDELERFRKKVIEPNQKLKTTFKQFKTAFENQMSLMYKGYKGGALIAEIIDLDSNVKEQLDSLYKTSASEKFTSVTESVLEMIEADDRYEDLLESKSEPDQYYMVVELALYDDKKSDKVPHKNFKNVLVTKANTPAQARRQIKSSANKSLKELNKKLKDSSMRCQFKKGDWFREDVVYKGYDSIKKKNIKSLSGSDTVSTGVYLLGGLKGFGTVSSVPEIAPNNFAIHSSKSSLGRYINKNFPKKDSNDETK